MKTKDFIKMLQKADPSGEAHIRMEGGIPKYAELKEGYWDGPYSYIDDNGNYVYSIENCKVDLYGTSIEDFVDEHINIHNANNWEEIKNKFIFNLGGYAIKEQRNERAESILKTAKEHFDFSTNIQKKFYQESIDDAIKRINEGWKFFQDKRVDNNDENSGWYYYYHWKIINPDGKETGSNLHDTQGIIKSGLFEKLDNSIKKGYYEWKLKNQ